MDMTTGRFIVYSVLCLLLGLLLGLSPAPPVVPVLLLGSAGGMLSSVISRRLLNGCAPPRVVGPGRWAHMIARPFWIITGWLFAHGSDEIEQSALTRLQLENLELEDRLREAKEEGAERLHRLVRLAAKLESEHGLAVHYVTGFDGVTRVHLLDLYDRPVLAPDGSVDTVKLPPWSVRDMYRAGVFGPSDDLETLRMFAEALRKQQEQERNRRGTTALFGGLLGGLRL